MLLIDRTTSKAGKSGNSTAQAIELALGVATPAGPDAKLSVSLKSMFREIEYIAYINR